jgi:oligosaccharide repeat unit polymerase
MITAWLLWLLLYSLPFFYYTTSISFRTIIFIVSCISCFVFGDTLIAYAETKTSQKKKFVSPLTEVRLGNSLRQLNKLVQILAIIGIFSAFLFLFSRLSFYGLDYSSGISAARFQRQRDTGAGVAPPIATVFGLLFYSCGSAAFLVACFQDSLTKLTKTLSLVSLVAPIIVTVTFGGRGAIYNLLVIIFSATLIRHFCNQKIFFLRIKKPNFMRLKVGRILIILVLVFSIYSVYIFVDRANTRNQVLFHENLKILESYKNVKPVQILIDLVDDGLLDGNILTNSGLTYSYLTQGPDLLTKLIESGNKIGPYFGQYQVPLIPVIIRKYLPAFDISQQLKDERLVSGLYGGGLTAWGSMLIDFGWVGALFESILYGAVSRIIYFGAINQGKLGDKLLCAFLMQSIIQSSYTAPLAGGGSAYVFIVFLGLRSTLNRLDNLSKLLPNSVKTKQLA